MSSSAPPTFYLCLDCGGTKTAAVLSDADGTIVARAYGGGSNASYLGVEAFLAVVKSVTASVLALALNIPPPALPINDNQDASGLQVPPFTLQAAWLGVSGVDSPAMAQKLLKPVAEILSLPPPPTPRLIISNDTHLLAAPVQTLPDVNAAVAIIGGTGSIVVSFREGEDTGAPLIELARTGGYGWILGDEGGGFDVGRTAIRALCTQRDAESAGAPPQPPLPSGKPLLRDRVLERFGIEDVLDTLGIIHLPDPIGPTPVALDGKYHYANHAREKRLSTLSPLVFQAALEDGDPLALGVLKDCAGKLAAQIASVLAKPENGATDRRVLASDAVACFGGSLVAIDAYRSLVLDALKELGHSFAHTAVVQDAAAAGAAALVAAWKDKV
ncbi:hypothetical protein PENSPDRAFT_573016 [Peniophora sp. CONT]|nr:hypothetical protein PENSPDRAFT_573016 [Peniophora sp. CONT]